MRPSVLYTAAVVFVVAAAVPARTAAQTESTLFAADFDARPEPALPGWLARAPCLQVDTAAPRAAVIREVVREVSDIRRDDRALREVVLTAESGGFDQLRKNYPLRRELSACEVADSEALSPALRETLLALGLRVK